MRHGPTLHWFWPFIYIYTSFDLYKSCPARGKVRLHCLNSRSGVHDYSILGKKTCFHGVLLLTQMSPCNYCEVLKSSLNLSLVLFFHQPHPVAPPTNTPALLAAAVASGRGPLKTAAPFICAKGTEEAYSFLQERSAAKHERSFDRREC